MPLLQGKYSHDLDEKFISGMGTNCQQLTVQILGSSFIQPV